jgi:nucleoside-diphosphate-sugar epimerase
MGAYLAQILSRAGHEVVVTTRQVRQDEEFVRYVLGNARDLGFVRSLLSEHWDAIVDFMVYTTEQFADRLDALLNATLQYVYLSSARVYAECDSPMGEDSPRLLDVSDDSDYLATDEYALSKAREEDLLGDSGRENWTIIRPYITYSEKRLQLGVLEKEEWLYRALNRRTIVFSKDMLSRETTMTYGFDVAKGIAALIGNTEVYGKMFHITAGQPLLWQDVLDIYLARIEQKCGFKPKVLLLELDALKKVRGGYYQICYDRLFNRKFDNRAIGQYVDVRAFIEAKDGLSRCIDEFLEFPNYGAINWRSEALKDRFAKEHTPLWQVHGLKNILRYVAYRYIGIGN